MSDPHLYRGRPWDRPLLNPPELMERLRAAAARHATRTAITEVTPRGEPTRSISYAQLWRDIEERAQRIPSAETGIGGTLATLVENTIDSLTTVFAIIRAGAAAVLIDSAETVERRTEMLAALACPLVETTDNGMVVLPPAPARVVTPELASPWRTAVVVFTTGSTAASKPVAQSGYSIAVNAEAVVRHHRLGVGTTLVCPLPVSHVNGLEFGIVATLLAGGHAVLVHRFDPLHFMRVLEQFRATVATTVPSILGVMAETRGGSIPAELRYVVSAAAPLYPATVESLWDRFRLRVVQGYGLSECMNFATTMPTDLSEADYLALMTKTEAPPVGSALPGCEVAVLDERDAEVSEGEIGEVCVRGHSIMTGYLGNPEANAAALHGGWLRTGDLGRLAAGPDGRAYLSITGRIKHIAKCGGLGVSLEEIERAVRRLPGVRDACCVSRSHASLGEAVTLYAVVRGPGEGGPTSATLRERVATVVDPGRCALRLVLLDELPKLRSGKPDRVTLAGRARTGEGVRS
ncbi:class I adenylate-forming enzyme family protein [Nocardia sp. N2S4-5]|uniref:class I adenylate-forming enzyme family protein n=1 Tax=Nocardia sp. N2S4-5 TaxID=3351565 RepID=UPI0037D8953B